MFKRKEEIITFKEYIIFLKIIIIIARMFGSGCRKAPSKIIILMHDLPQV